MESEAEEPIMGPEGLESLLAGCSVPLDPMMEDLDMYYSSSFLLNE